MGKLCEGNRVFTAAVDATADEALINDWQDQVKGMLGPLNRDITGLGLPDSGGGWSFAFDPPPSPTNHYWGCSTPDGDLIVFCPDVRVGQKITQVSFALRGSQNGGQIDWCRRSWDVDPASAPTDEAVVQTIKVSGDNAWNTGGTNAQRYDVTLTGTNGVIADGYTYYFKFTASAGGSGQDFIHFVGITEQFGN